MVDIKEFVRDSILSIVEGVQEASQGLQGKGSRMRISSHSKETYDNYNTEKVNFDIAVTVEEDKTRGGGFKVAVVALKAGAKTETGNKSSSISRISFSVPIGFQVYTEEELTQRKLDWKSVYES